ncbi:helix-turn-helix transcriptional regulator [Gordonia insulae]|uniref:HTH luxR-type domain-containing protein n=1 Tax=Gordonia insulae TaxID=2420509 RepID=A0A3G8JGP1_9ACTN|nr:LuxR C-terminal-related transcriptional regulator [Gordonia insulae]AZG44236.1 hypothetical protein D7316_00820 [Gordonia insulae]
MTVIADHVQQHHSSVRNGGNRPALASAGAAGDGRDARRRAEATRRRQEALARLAQRRMPLPGMPLPGDVDAPGHRTDGARGRAHMTLVTSAGRSESAGVHCSCGLEQADMERPSLTTREVEVLRTWLMVDSKPAVAEELYISLGTVNTHLTRIRAKYSDVGRAAPTKAALVARAVQDGLIALDEL